MAQRISSTVLDGQIKFIQERINSTEHQLSQLCYHFAGYSRKLASIRDKGDELSKSVKSYAEQAQLNRSSQAALLNVSDTLMGLQDYRDTETRRIDYNVVNKLTGYSALCKHARDNIKQRLQVQEKEKTQRRQLETLRTRSPQNRQQISLAETELQKVKADISRTSRMLDEEIDKFERQKISDVKKILSNFIQIELLYHTKAIEMYTKAYNQVAAIDEQKDIEEFRNALRLPNSDNRLELVQNTSLSDSFGSSSLRNISTSSVSKKGAKLKVAESLDSIKVEEYEDSDTESSAEEQESSMYKMRSRKRSI